MNDEELLRSFEDQTLPYDAWTHRAHVKVAFLYLRQNGLTDDGFWCSVNKMRTGIQRYNAAQQVPEGPTSGYNETTTVAFMQLVAATMAAYGELFPTPHADAFCDTHPQLRCKEALRLFYSPARRSLPEAKTRFVEPDLAPLPRFE
ncbi:MAG: hypothetical protein KDA42_18995 [Planctomycetales bacterium]|nr:hypothetical protein [Planctomycetales bacterium]